MTFFAAILLPFLVLGALGVFLYVLSFSGDDLSLRAEFKLREYFRKIPGVTVDEREEGVRRSGFAEIEGTWNGRRFVAHQSFEGRGKRPHLSFSFHSDCPPFVITRTKGTLGDSLLAPKQGREKNKIELELAEDAELTSSQTSIPLGAARASALKGITLCPEFLFLRKAGGLLEVVIYGFPFAGVDPEQGTLHPLLGDLLASF